MRWAEDEKGGMAWVLKQQRCVHLLRKGVWKPGEEGPTPFPTLVCLWEQV